MGLGVLLTQGTNLSGTQHMVPCAELSTPPTTTTTPITTTIAVGITGRRIRVQLSWQPQMPSVMCVPIHIV